MKLLILIYSLGKSSSFVDGEIYRIFSPFSEIPGVATSPPAIGCCRTNSLHLCLPFVSLWVEYMYILYLYLEVIYYHFAIHIEDSALGGLKNGKSCLLNDT